ncbi:16S rRNA (cytosine(1402)-N(4))-methyltransferase [candidate division LCP-89 bacterium B3_LCP]|uniref:Ribosomal RNA small subunit methyltransferase H n=1 Tax=candidate division LCP-89 bacterium B3_LCP TaxID=2012998 RepID=A0A532V2N3_UNCL8|nr:MAG: 16S rRNA (cytosine(1402)-N(4))-methyltransferase [candidate division LCP-89 bacterium B3_LCP]
MTPESCITLHRPVMVDSVMKLLLTSNPDDDILTGTMVDGTVGGGGHAEAILEKLSPAGRIFCFDRDPAAISITRQRLKSDPRIQLVHDSYSEIGEYLDLGSAAGVILDLGLSSDQLEAARGFSHSQDSILDMRFDPSARINAHDVINSYSIEKLRNIFFRYGEEPLSPRIARNISNARQKGAIRTSEQLAAVIKNSVPARFEMKAVSRIFQAIRIEVNSEIELLEAGLKACWDILKDGGVLCVISYHSIEDRRMKRFIAEKVKGCVCPPKLPVCACGQKPSAQVLTSSALRPSPKEIRLNPRSRSARLRAARKIPSK